MENQAIKIDVNSIPDFRVRELLEAMTAPLREFYADPENQRKYEEWLARRQARKEKV